jgi:hypothetical protein
MPVQATFHGWFEALRVVERREEFEWVPVAQPPPATMDVRPPPARSSRPRAPRDERQ